MIDDWGPNIIMQRTPPGNAEPQLGMTLPWER